MLEGFTKFQDMHYLFKPSRGKDDVIRQTRLTWCADCTCRLALEPRNAACSMTTLCSFARCICVANIIGSAEGKKERKKAFNTLRQVGMPTHPYATAACAAVPVHLRMKNALYDIVVARFG